MLQEVSSFRDPAGQIVINGNSVRRIINAEGLKDYDIFMRLGLYDELVEEGLLIPHDELSPGVIEPEFVPFISYPYEWPFNYLKMAALNTLDITRRALKHGMIMKDASAYNMQWVRGKMRLIDTLSFTSYNDGQPWYAYRQFIQHFLSPLLLCKYRAPVSPQIDGIDPGLAFDLLPFKAKSLPVWMHLGAQSLSGKVKSTKPATMPKRNLLALLDNLRSFIEKLEYKPKKGWADYNECSYSPAAKLAKMGIVDSMLRDLPHGTLSDIGANTGDFTQLALAWGFDVTALERDYGAANILADRLSYTRCLVQDLCSPSPAIGWASQERKSFLDRWNPDVVMMLAVIHHICIGNNVPLRMVSDLLKDHAKQLIIEFVPADDPMSVKIAGNKIYPAYSQEIFESEFSRHYTIISKQGVEDSCRTIYLMSQ